MVPSRQASRSSRKKVFGRFSAVEVEAAGGRYGMQSENSMRPVALGRKNWLHIGSPQAGPRVATFFPSWKAVVSAASLAASPGAQLLFHGSPRAYRSPNPAPPERYSICVDRSLFKDSSDRGPGVKVIRDHLSGFVPISLNSCGYSAVVGSITDLISETRFAGNPPCCACSRTIFSSGAI